MAESFRASFVLALKDDLSAGLRKIIAETKQLRDLAKSLGFKPLEGADAIVNRVDRDVVQLNRDLGATARQAETAAGAIRRMSAAELGRAREMGRQSAALNRQLAAGGGLGGIYGPGGIPLMAGGPRFVPNESGPSSTRGLRGRVGNAIANGRARFGAANEQIGLAGGALAGISLMEPIREAAEFDNVLTHIAITAGATGDQVRTMVKQLSDEYRTMAIATEQSSHDIADAGMFMITTGWSKQLVDQVLPMMAKASTAYNTPMQDTRQGAFAIAEGLGMKPEDMPGALSAAALAGRQGHFYFSDISSLFPEIISVAGKGFQGRAGLDVLLAAAEGTRRGAGSSGQAATNMKQFLGDISGGSNFTNRRFAKEGMDLPKMLLNAEKLGVNPLEAVMAELRKRTLKMTAQETTAFLGKLFGNQEARIFATSYLKEFDFIQTVKEKLSAAGNDVIEEDFKKAQNLHTRLVTLSEQSHQLSQRLGDGFSWVVPVGIALTGGLLEGLKWMDVHLPGVSTALIGATGGMLGLTAAMGVLGTVAGPVKAGFILLSGAIRSIFAAGSAALLNPWTLPLVALGALALDVYENWDKFGHGFHEIIDGIVKMFSGDIFAGVRQAFQGITDVVQVLRDQLNDLRPALGDLAVPAPKGQADERKSRGEDPNGRDDLGLPGLENVPMGNPPEGRRDKNISPGAYYPGAGGGAQTIHITFTADVPGRATLEDRTPGAMARGPMLSRA